MKKLPFLLALAAILLCACVYSDQQTPNGISSPVESSSAEEIPPACSLYYDYRALTVIAPENSTLPLSADAKRGAPGYIPIWHNGEYTQLASGGEGYTMEELTGGKATEAGDYGRFCWDNTLYHCIHVQAKDSFLPDFVSIGGGILWIEIMGDCYADNGTEGGIGMFGGFDTVILTGSGTLRLAQSIESGTGERPFPALIVDGPLVSTPGLALIANQTPQKTANLVVLNGSLESKGNTFVNGDACVAGGALNAGQLLDCATLVCRGGLVSVKDGWSFSKEAPSLSPSLILSGGEFETQAWMESTIEYHLWHGEITAPGVRNWPKTYLYGDAVILHDTTET